jgi:protein-disulfide isomerase
MENPVMNDERWVDERLRALDAGNDTGNDTGNDWHPNAGAALAGLQRRDRRRRSRQRGWIWSTAMASVCAVVMIALPAPAKCALVGVGCQHPRAAALPILPQSAVAAAKPAVQGHAEGYKQSGSPNAPVIFEIYSDYECPACAAFYTRVFPQFEAEYVKTGKVRVIHRDFPLPQHPFAKLAARYANAAGETGHYEEVVKQLFASQPEWAATGNVDGAVARVLSPETMLRVRALVKSDTGLDATVAADLSMAGWDHIDQTPTIVFVYKGIREKVAGAPSFDLLRSFVEGKLTPGSSR